METSKNQLMTCWAFAWLTFISHLAWAGPAAAAPPELGLPLKCKPGSTCFIQQYVDVDHGPDAIDYTCGALTYNGHKGTDFRIRFLKDVEKGVPVLATAAGIVKAVRDGLPDRLIKNSSDQRAIKDRECGNGVVISHGDGWETQYCHLRKDSLIVKKGEQLSRGQPVGEVGYSGNAAFPHVHLTVRHNGKIVDPFTGIMPTDRCNPRTTESLWKTSVAKSLVYETAQILKFGFASNPVRMENLVAGSQPPFVPSRNAPALVIYMWSINLLRGDQVHLAINGPNGKVIQRKMPQFKKNRAQQMFFTGKKRPLKGWPAGTYTGRLVIVRNGARIRQKIRSFKIK